MYVSPTRAKWDDQTEQFNLVAYQNSVEDDVDFKDGSDFYFGLRVFLEHGPNTYPKHAFWFLFRGKQGDDNNFTVRVQRSGREFKLYSEIDALCEHLFELLKDELAASPFSRAAKEPFRIGFTGSK
ncbi:MAG: hypothetical protein WBG11_05885 [Methylocella sp.]